MDLGPVQFGAPRLAQARRALDRMWTYRRQFDQRRAVFYRQYIGQRDAQKFP